MTVSEGALFQPGDLIAGRYRLMRLIGSGAMGIVWSARNESTDRDFALKLMLPSSASNPARLQRFFQEAKACGRLRHRCIVEVYDLGRIESIVGKPADPHAGTPYLVMELLEGEPLDNFLRRIGALPIGTALRIIADVAQGLEVAHKAGVVHRDLKPANLFLHKSPEGETTPKILDFGISKLTWGSFDAITNAGTILGSPAYMSPEQTMGDGDIDARSDVWSLGVILYRALSGQLPFRGNGYRAMLELISSAKPTPIETLVSGLPVDVVAIVDRCLKADRVRRFQSAQELADACIAALARTSLPRMDLSGEIAAPVELAAEDLHTVASVRKITPHPSLALATDPQETSPTRSIVQLPPTSSTMTVDAPLDPPTTDATTTTVAEDVSSRLAASQTITRSSDADSTTRRRSVRPAPPRRWGLAVGALAIIVGLVAFGFSRKTNREATSDESTETRDEARHAAHRSPKETTVPTEALAEAPTPVAAPIATSKPSSPEPSASPSSPVQVAIAPARAQPPRAPSSAPPRSTTTTAATATTTGTAASKPHPAPHEGVTNAGF